VMKKRYILLLAFTTYWLFSAWAFGQEAETLHGNDWLDIGLYLLALFGTGGLASAAIPSKVRTAIPLVKMIMNFVGTNFWNAKNKDD